MATSSSDQLGWLDDVSAVDLVRAGIADELQEGTKPAFVLARWADEFAVDLTQVHDCLRLLCDGKLLLHVGSPLALAAYSPRRQRYRVSFDTDFSSDLADLSFAGTATWLTVLASEVVDLPTIQDHWSILRLEPAGISGRNQTAVDEYRHYAHIAATTPDPASLLEPYACMAAQAFWRCASYALR